MQGIKMAAAGEKKAFTFALPANLFEQCLFEYVQTIAMFGREFDERVCTASGVEAT